MCSAAVAARRVMRLILSSSGLLQKIYTSIGAGKRRTPLIWMLPPCVLQKRGKEPEMNGKAWEKQGCWGVVICPAQLLTHLWSLFMGSEDRKTTWSTDSWALPAGMAWRTRWVSAIARPRLSRTRFFCPRLVGAHGTPGVLSRSREPGKSPVSPNS